MIFSEPEFARKTTVDYINSAEYDGDDYYEIAIYKYIWKLDTTRIKRDIGASKRMIIYKRRNKSYRSLKYVAYYQKTPFMLKNHSKENGYDIIYLPNELITADLLINAVKDGGLKFYLIPRHMRTPELTLYAVQNNVHDLRYVPYSLQTQEIANDVARSEYGRDYLDRIANRFKTEEFYENLLLYDWRALSLIPDESKTANLCEIAVRDCPRALKFVPERLQTNDLCLYAIEKDPECAKYIKTQYFD